MRYHGDIARIEVGVDEIPTILAHRQDIVKALKDCSFTYVTLDLGGYEMGSLNEALDENDMKDKDE